MSSAPKKTSNEESYGASDIQVLEGLEAVRKRPGMYIGSTGPRGLHHLVYEIVDNSVDEALAGHCDQINVVMLADGGVRVSDNGRGIPVDEHPVEKRSTVEVVLTTLHAGGKFGGGGYAVSGGLHGVGSSVVNALSQKLTVDVKRQGSSWTQSYQNGVPDAPLAKAGATDVTGTTIEFWPNSEIFETVDFDYETLRTRFQQMAFLNKGLQIDLVDERPPAVVVKTPISMSKGSLITSNISITPRRPRLSTRTSSPLRPRTLSAPLLSKLPCSGPPRIPRASTPMPTPSTPTREELTKRASAPR